MRKKDKFFEERLAHVNDMYKAVMKTVSSIKYDEGKSFMLSVETICLAEMELFELHAISLEDFIKIKIEHITGEGKIAQYYKEKFGGVFADIYGETLKNILKNKEENTSEKSKK